MHFIWSSSCFHVLFLHLLPPFDSWSLIVLSFDLNIHTGLVSTMLLYVSINFLTTIWCLRCQVILGSMHCTASLPRTSMYLFTTVRWGHVTAGLASNCRVGLCLHFCCHCLISKPRPVPVSHQTLQESFSLFCNISKWARLAVFGVFGNFASKI